MAFKMLAINARADSKHAGPSSREAQEDSTLDIFQGDLNGGPIVPAAIDGLESSQGNDEPPGSFRAKDMLLLASDTLCAVACVQIGNVSTPPEIEAQ
jgi:hypothetical protein